MASPLLELVLRLVLVHVIEQVIIERGDDHRTRSRQTANLRVIHWKRLQPIPRPLVNLYGMLVLVLPQLRIIGDK